MVDASRMFRRAVSSTRNVVDLLRTGHLAEPYGAPFAVVDQGPHHRLREYATCADSRGPVALLVPPLMITSEVYDIDAELSAVAALGRLGVRPFVVDFGAPEHEAGGFTRTLDDHVIAAAASLERVRALTGRAVHLCGYSQGGMFAYQTAAFVRSEGVASVITFGSPVDLHKSLPAVHSDATGALLRALDPIATRVIDRIEALPGALTAAGFKVLSGRKEIQSRLEFVRSLHDRRALVRREARRRFLGGGGFVAWPGPAFRAFVDQFVVHNRMLSGGFVLGGRTVTLADITCPILAFVGLHDEMARPAAVRGIAKAAPEAPVSFVPLKAGHFGLVVGSTAVRETWPTVAAWIHHREGNGPLPEVLRAGEAREAAREDEPEGAGFDVDLGPEAVFDALSELGRAAWRRVGEAAARATDAYDGMRYQEPRLRELALMTDDTRTSLSSMFAARARETPEATSFLWRGRAFTYAVSNARIDNVVRGLWSCGVRPGERVGVVMGSRPSLLVMLTALGRLGAVPVLAPPEASSVALSEAFARVGVSRVACDPDHASVARASAQGGVLVLGGGSRRRDLGEGLTDMEAIDPAHVTLPGDLVLDAGRAGDLALVLLKPGEGGALRDAPVTHRRLALSALGAAAACTLTPEDTVYCAVPLHHPTGVLVCVGAALAGGSRLALGERFDAAEFLPEARRYGATVAFYAGEMLRALVHLPPGRGDRTHPLRLLAGSGMRADLWVKLKERFGVDVMEFYASTSQRIVVANASGEKVGALGKKLPGSADFLVARVDLATGAPARDAQGALVAAEIEEPGLLVARLDEREEAPPGARVIEAPDGRWCASRDVVWKDVDGDLWFVDSLDGFVRTDAGVVSTRQVEDALYGLAEVELAVAWGEERAGRTRLRAAVVAKGEVPRERVTAALSGLEPHARPDVVARVESLGLTEGFRPDRRAARRRFEG